VGNLTVYPGWLAGIWIQLTVKFFEKVTKTKLMMRFEELEVWETWAVTIKINPALMGGLWPSFHFLDSMISVPPK